MPATHTSWVREKIICLGLKDLASFCNFVDTEFVFDLPDLTKAVTITSPQTDCIVKGSICFVLQASKSKIANIYWSSSFAVSLSRLFSIFVECWYGNHPSLTQIRTVTHHYLTTETGAGRVHNLFWEKNLTGHMLKTTAGGADER